jgi:hypothetical protein
MNLPATLFLVACLVPCAGTAQTIYRCSGNEYTRVPCPDGRPVEALDTRSAAQRAEARRIVAEEEKRAKEMERDRHKQEASIKPAASTSLGAAPVATASSAPKKAAKKKRRKPELDADRDFQAAVPGHTKKGSEPR